MSPSKKNNLIFIPGWNMQAKIFQPFAYNLSDDFNVYYFDPPIIEQPVDNAYDVALEKLLDFIKENKIAENLTVVGWSLGGQLAMLLANEISVRKLVLIASAAIFSRNQQEKERFYQLCATDFTRAAKYFHKLMGQLNIEDSILLQQNFIDNQQHGLNYLKELHQRDLTEVSKKISCSTIIIHSQEDKIIPFSEAKYLKSLIKSVQLIGLPGDLHFPFLNEYGTITCQILA